MKLVKGASVQHLHMLMTQSLQQKKVSLRFSLERLSMMVNAAQSRGQGDVWVAADAKNEVKAAVFLCWDTQYTYYLAGGMDRTGKQIGAPRWLLWQALQHALAERRGLDFGGGMVPSVAAVYVAMGAESADYLRLQQYHPFWSRFFIHTLKKMYAPQDSAFH
ncbi:MAG: GNAT family N-acetyltransferase [Lewinellaceae bacterium]|nr:GNAT family N-acetyltransferase [Lewinellaceae bacterium]